MSLEGTEEYKKEISLLKEKYKSMLIPVMGGKAIAGVYTLLLAFVIYNKTKKDTGENND